MAYPTEAESAHQRRAIREAYPRLFESIEQQFVYVDEYAPTIPPKRDLTTYELALNAHLARATKTAMGIVALCEHGFGEMAMAALRTLGELMVSAYFMSLDQEIRAKRFESFAHFEQVEIFKLFGRLGWEDALGELTDKYTAEFMAEVEAQFPSPVLGWTQTPMNQLIDAIEPCWERPVELRQLAHLLHVLGDEHAHVGTLDTMMLMRADDEGLVLHVGPGRKWVPQALQMTAWIYGQVFDLWAEHFQMPTLDSWRRRWRLLNARAHPLTEEQARGVGRNDPCPCGSGFKFKRCHYDLVR